MADTFNESVKQAAGSYSGDYLWSANANWSGGLPTAATAVSLNFGLGASAVDTNVSVASVTYGAAGTLLIGGALNTGALTGTVANSTLSVLSNASLAVAGTLNLTGGALDIAGHATIGSLGLNSVTIEGTATIGQIGGGTVTVGHGGTLEVTSGTNAALSAGHDAFVLNGGTLKLDSSVVLLSSTSFAFGATSANGASSVYIGDMANFNQQGFLNNSFNGFDVGDSLLFASAKFSSYTYSRTSHTLDLFGANSGPSYTLSNLNLAAGAGSASFSLTAAANGGTLVTLNCFLAGTRIETPRGAVAIETLSVGDLVLTVEQGARIAKPVRWIGTRQVDPGWMETQAARDASPVRIRAHAFSDGVPARDLLVTGDHCIFDSGGLIPARMLVNGASIVREELSALYEVHHIEFETHSIVLAEGLTTESFLDTGGDGFGTAPARGKLSWARDAVAPLTTARTAVEPVWQRLALRAEACGAGAARAGMDAATTTDAALCVRLADGALLGARRQRGMRHFFVLPAGQGSVILHSRSAVPADVEGPFVDDRRRLGVCVRSATLWTELRSTALPLGTGGQPGWHALEPSGNGCWTNGAGMLELPALAQPTVLEIELIATHRYPLCEDATPRLRA